MKSDIKKLKIEFKEKLKSMTDAQIIDSFNHEVGNFRWTGEKASFHEALHEEFDNRGFDYSAIGTKGSLSFRKRIKLFERRVLIDEQYS